MSTQQQKSELLSFGYVNTVYNSSIPVHLIKLIQIFYDDWIYWLLKDKKLETFIQTNERIVCEKQFNIKGIRFEIFAYPHPQNVTFKDVVFIGLKIQYLPPNIEYCQFYQEITCESLHYAPKGLCKVKKSGKEFGGFLCQLSELKNMKTVCFNFIVNIEYIKYKKDSDKDHYYSSINKLQKYSQFTWNINNSLMQKCKTMSYKQLICSNKFDNNNWCLSLFPNGRSTKSESAICVNCLSLQHTINTIDVKCTFDIKGFEPLTCTWDCKYEQLLVEWPFMTFIEFKEKKSLSITVTLEIENIYDENNHIIEKNKWNEYGIVME